MNTTESPTVHARHRLHTDSHCFCQARFAVQRIGSREKGRMEGRKGGRCFSEEVSARHWQCKRLFTSKNAQLSSTSKAKPKIRGSIVGYQCPAKKSICFKRREFSWSRIKFFSATSFFSSLVASSLISSSSPSFHHPPRISFPFHHTPSISSSFHH